MLKKINRKKLLGTIGLIAGLTGAVMFGKEIKKPKIYNAPQIQLINKFDKYDTALNKIRKKPISKLFKDFPKKFNPNYLRKENKLKFENNFRMFSHLILNTAREHNIDPALALALVHVESNFNHFSRSNANAFGLIQVRPILYKEIKRLKKLGKVEYAPEKINELSPTLNLKTGFTYLDYLIKNLGNEYDALRAYNVGLSKSLKDKNAGREYALKVLKLKKQYEKITN